MSHVYVWNCSTVLEGLTTFQGLWLHFVSIIGWAVQESSGFRQSLPQQESDTPREWKNIVTWLLLSLFILCKCPSCGYGAGCVIARSRKEKEEQNWLSFLSKYKHENVHHPAAAWSISDPRKETNGTVINKATGQLKSSSQQTDQPQGLNISTSTLNKGKTSC